MTAHLRVASVPVPVVPRSSAILSNWRETNGNFCSVVMITGTAFSSASASWRELFVDPLHDAERVFELVDRVLELLIEHDAIGDHDHAIEDARVGSIVQGREPMRQPTDRVALAAARGMLDKVVVPYAFAACRVHQHAHRFELVVAGEDHGLCLDLAAPMVAFLVGLQVDEAGEEVEQAVALQHLFPQVRRAVGPALRIRRVARRLRRNPC